MKNKIHQSNNLLIDRIENRAIDKYWKSLRFSMIVLIILGLIKFFIGYPIKLTGIGWWIDTLLLVISPIIYFSKFQKLLINRSNQFIDWFIDTITYKLKNDNSQYIIQREEIKEILIHLNRIEVTDDKNQMKILDISDFLDYKTRIKIKSNFEIEKDNLLKQIATMV